MGAYILRRLLLVIPTLLGVMIVNFSLTQFVPGGPVEQIIANMEGQGNVFETISGGRGDAAVVGGHDAEHRDLPEALRDAAECVAEGLRSIGARRPERPVGLDEGIQRQPMRGQYRGPVRHARHQ